MSENMTMKDAFKKTMYAGIGLAAVSVDLLAKAVETLAVRGEEAVAKGKVANEELKRKSAVAKAGAKDIAESLEKMTKEEIELIRSKVDEIRKNWNDKGDEGAEG